MRDERIVWLFVAGHGYRQIAKAVGLRSPQSVCNVVRRELGQLHGGAMTELGRAIFVERSEALLRASWPDAMAGDYHATKVCLGLLDQQARFYGLYED